MDKVFAEAVPSKKGETKWPESLTIGDLFWLPKKDGKTIHGFDTHYSKAS